VTDTGETFILHLEFETGINPEMVYRVCEYHGMAQRREKLPMMMLSRLRKIEALTIKIAEEMPIHYEIETDALYLKGTEKGMEKGMEKGIEKGIEKGMEKGIEKGMEKGIEKGIEKGRELEAAEKDYIFVNSLLINTDFDDAYIAFVANVTLAYVQKLRLEWASKNNLK
jgi:flagellar biosynthesis/type III secretory pathway protein FliH